jgi:hypothetical protein
MKTEHRIIIGKDGTLRFIYSDALAALLGERKATVKRASHVEPTDDGRWTADMTPLGGSVLGPFTLRQEALDAEVAWRKEHNIPVLV